MSDDLNGDPVCDPFCGRSPAEVVFDVHEAATSALNEFAALRTLLDDRGTNHPLPTITIKNIISASGKLEETCEVLGPLLEGVAGWWVADRPPAFALRCVSAAEAILLASVHLVACLKDSQPEWYGAINDGLENEESRRRFDQLFGPDPDEESSPKSLDDLEGYLARQIQRETARLGALNLPFLNEFSLVCEYAAERGERYNLDEVAASLTCEAAMLCRLSSPDANAKARYRGMRRLSNKIASHSFSSVKSWAFGRVAFHSEDFPQWRQTRESGEAQTSALSAAAIPLSGTDELILEAICTRPLTPKEIHHAIGGDRTHMFRRLEILRTREQIKKDVRTGEYHRTDRETGQS